MDTHSDVTIVGGGLVGPLLALALADHGVTVVVLDALAAKRQKDPEFDGRAYALSLTSIRLLQVLGLWATLQDHAQPILDIKVSDGRQGEGASPLFLHFDHREIDEGPMGHMIEDRHLRRALLDAMCKHDAITHLDQRRVVALDDGMVHSVGPRGGQSIHKSHLIIGCDGRQSQIAQWSGIGRTGWDYDQTSIVCAIDHDDPHAGTAHQFFTPAGPLAILPLQNNRSSIVWTEYRDVAAEILSRDDAGFLQALRPVFGDFLGDIELAGGRFSYPLGLSLATALVGPRVALVGDAGHGIHPLAGQGLNLGVRDVAALAEVVVNARRIGEDIGAVNVLERYQRWRRFDIAALAVATDGINRIFSNDNSILRGIRDIGLGAVNRAPGLRRLLIRQAAGLSGDLPKLLAGNRI